ncbi:uncharacterized protein LOC129225896 [Uloborus diversus]|uniref:uncharacterized protein LOC129225896 n=1 Tax=Uloborus diversus TaxID=327109 RepID=UPI0024093FFA|nr:uncharacterized protein LOC129225896 [Uloborus diversus]
MPTNVNDLNEAYCIARTANLLRQVYPHIPEYPTFNVRRNLFGRSESETPVNSENLNRVLSAKAEQAKHEWNFDFVTEKPKPAGRYVWELVRSCDLPSWYSASERQLNKHIQVDFEDMVEESDHSSNGEKENSTSDFNQIDAGKSMKGKRRFVQTTMRDFTRVQKRRSSKRLRLKQLNRKFLLRPNVMLRRNST